MKKQTTSFSEAADVVNKLIDEQKYVININTLPDNGEVVVQWIEHKTYKAGKGEEFPDEVWVTKDNQLMLIQDLSEAHCKNILRMLLRGHRTVDAVTIYLDNHLTPL